MAMLLYNSEVREAVPAQEIETVVKRLMDWLDKKGDQYNDFTTPHFWAVVDQLNILAAQKRESIPCKALLR